MLWLLLWLLCKYCNCLAEFHDNILQNGIIVSTNNGKEIFNTFFIFN